MSTTDEAVRDAKRRAAADHVLDATRRLVGREGLDVTMHQIAEASGVSRRTLFRHFETRERLVAAALASGMRRYGEQLPPLADDWRSWLRATCRTAHRINDSYGPGYWELTTRRDLVPDLAAVEQRRRRARRGAMTRIADTLWSAAGGSGRTPARVVAAVGAHLSAHFTAAVTTDVDSTATVAAELAEAAILDALRSAGLDV
jgi:AcrR family transcriptional regulator